jgi:hypothetical protein
MAATATAERMDFAEYAALPDVHATALRHMLTSPLAYKRALEVPCEETDAMRVGRAIHTAVLEPDRFLAEYVLWEGGIRRGKAWDEFEASAGHKTILKPEQYAVALRVRDSARSHKIASKYLSEPGKAELSIRWVHDRTGVAIKCRLDWLCSVLADVKSARDVDPARFSASCARYGYALQLALYSDAAAAAGYGVLPVKMIVAQTTEPFDVAVYDVPREVIEAGQSQYERALDLYVECSTAKSWPGIAPDSELTLHLPAWASAESNDEEILFGDQAI